MTLRSTVLDGRLYGVGNGGGVYTITRGRPSQRSCQISPSPWTARPSASISTRLLTDFEIVSDTGQNLRHNVNPGGTTIADAPLNNGGTTATGITATTYTNNDLDAGTGTTLLNLDLWLDQVSLQSPPNNGSLVATGKLTVDAGGPAAFDIYTRLEDGVAVENRAFAALSVGGVSGWYRVDL